MMNLVGISLVVSTLIVGGIWSPNPAADQNHNNRGEEEQVIVAGGHRAVLVEYADTTGQGYTKVSISPPSAALSAQDSISSAAASVAGVAEEPKEKMKAAMGAENGHVPGPRELICDAFGKCKHKISRVLNRAKEVVSDTAHEFEDEAKGVVDKETEMASQAIHKVEDGGEKMGEAATHASEEFLEKSKIAGEDIAKNVSHWREAAVEKAKEAGEKVEDAAKKVKEKGKQGKEELADVARRGQEVLCDAVGYVVSPEWAELLMVVIQLMGFATAYGVSMWVTFVMSYVLAEVLPRQQFGMVQSKIYPVYFKTMAVSIGLSLLGHLLGQRNRVFSHKAEVMQGYNLLGSLLLVLANLLFLEPRASKVMFERMKLEKEEGGGRESFTLPTRYVNTLFTDTAGRGTTSTPATTHPSLPSAGELHERKSKMEKMNDKLKKLNSYSSSLNIMTLMGLSCHLLYLSQGLNPNT
ncbi:hypothetical protein Ancab_036659 [Ancistrocladus abbreviatus]